MTLDDALAALAPRFKAHEKWDACIRCARPFVHAIKPARDRRNAMMQLLNLRRDKRYRSGIIQLAVLVDIITHDEWCLLDAQITKGVREITWTH